ncbi:MAG: enoyl-CoA hydratase/isomerase family protein [Deltaproteobacteria bacterium]|nr:enoyl-CoA hydratase/isomerase family protein [Deltaproteobacteria bacterium]MBW2419446.1 enoyl-CoA hydratase/isomerase family protein [Deltaproteobacteria bacterium]
MDLRVTRYAVEEGIATLTLNRPERLNAWTGRMHTEYRWILEQAERDDRVRVVVVTGEGRGFCAGADTAALEKHVERGGYDPGTPDDLPEPGYGVRPEFDANFAFQFGLSKPVIAAINGPAAGAGFVIACYADLRFAARGVKLTTAHGRLNLPAEFGLSWLLPRLIGLTRANDLLLSSRIFMSDEAMELGLLNALLEPEALLPHTYAYARELVQTVSPGSLQTTKRQIYTDLHRDVGSAVRESDALLDRMMKQADYREAVAALREKRPPRWSEE